jgi:hypothetical protein
MSDKGKHDELADALAKLAGGEVAPSEHEPPAPLAPSPTTPPSARSQRPAASANGRGASPPARPHRPTAPAPRPNAPTLSSPPTSSPPPGATDDHAGSEIAPLSSDGEEEHHHVTLDDDDAVIVPAPDLSAFAPRPHARRPVGVGRHAAIYQTIEFRRTIIPVLLTCGVLTTAFGSLKYALGEDSPLADLPRWLPIGLFITGAMLLGLAVVNMLSVRQQLLEARGSARQPSPPSPR